MHKMKTISKKTHLANIDANIESCKTSGETEFQKCWELYRAEVAAKKETTAQKSAAKMERTYAKIEARYSTFKHGQLALLLGKFLVRVLEVSHNGVWITRVATDAEWFQCGIDQIRERVSFKDLSVSSSVELEQVRQSGIAFHKAQEDAVTNSRDAEVAAYRKQEADADRIRASSLMI